MKMLSAGLVFLILSVLPATPLPAQPAPADSADQRFKAI